ncbi:DNA-binding transcriptional activator BglJ [Klebsiella sp. R445]
MGQPNTTRCIAVVEPCAMTAIGLRHILNEYGTGNYCVHFFKNVHSLRRTLRIRDITAVIFSLSGQRWLRVDSLLYLRDVAYSHPEVRRIILANDSGEAGLIKKLTPSCLHGIINKATCREVLQQELFLLLPQPAQPVDQPLNSQIAVCQIFSPTEHSILCYMTYGYSLLEIALQLGRNIKTIRAHKCNAMIKLGISSDLALLSAGDILVHLSPESVTNAHAIVA